MRNHRDRNQPLRGRNPGRPRIVQRKCPGHMSRYPRYRDPVRMPSLTRMEATVTYGHTVTSALRLPTPKGWVTFLIHLVFVLTCLVYLNDGVAF